MTKVYRKEIKECKQCHHCVKLSNEHRTINIHLCDAESRVLPPMELVRVSEIMIDNQIPIPYWCPLEDKEEIEDISVEPEKDSDDGVKEYLVNRIKNAFPEQLISTRPSPRELLNPETKQLYPSSTFMILSREDWIDMFKSVIGSKKFFLARAEKKIFPGMKEPEGAPYIFRVFFVEV